MFRARMEPPELVDRPKVQFDLLREAEKEYGKNTGEKVEYWQRRMMARFTRNLASMNGDLVAGVFDLAVAARSVVDDNYAYEVWQTANRYPAQKPASELLETVNLSSEEIWYNTKKLRLRRRLPRPKQRLAPRGLKQRKKEKFDGEWARQTDGTAICSYPPEDLMIEDYGRFLKRRPRACCRRSAPGPNRSPHRFSTASICARPFATGTRPRFMCASWIASRAKWARQW